MCQQRPEETLLGTLQDVGVYQSTCHLGRSGVILILACLGYFVVGLWCLIVGRPRKLMDVGRDDVRLSSLPEEEEGWDEQVGADEGGEETKDSSGLHCCS
jgi:hypothetical protein